jgi:plastocyanin
MINHEGHEGHEGKRNEWGAVDGVVKVISKIWRVWAVGLLVVLGPAAVADLTGKVVYDGKPAAPKKIDMRTNPECVKLHADPVFENIWIVGENGALKNAVVWVKDGNKLGGEAKNGPVVLDQNGCMYEPRVVAVMVGQELRARNSDPCMHNVHGLPKENGEFNIAQNQKGQEDKLDATKFAEIFTVTCNVHKWMNAWVIVLDHPFFAVTDEKGEFAIKGLKDGKYTLVCWHEQAATPEAQIEVKEGKATVEFKVGPKKSTTK